MEDKAIAEQVKNLACQVQNSALRKVDVDELDAIKDALMRKMKDMLEPRLQTVEQDVTALNTKITKLDAKVTALETQLTSQVATLMEHRKEDLQTVLAAIRDSSKPIATNPAPLYTPMSPRLPPLK